MKNLAGLRSIIMMLIAICLATQAYAMSPEEFEEKWSKDHYIREVDKRVDMIGYSVKYFHSWHIRVTELKAKPNKMPGSKIWVVKRIVHPVPDAAIISVQREGMFTIEVKVACIVYQHGVPYVTWKTKGVSKPIIDILLRQEGSCPV